MASGSAPSSTVRLTTWAVRDHASRLKRGREQDPIRILIVDDEPPVLKFVDRVLDDAGYETVTAASGAEALKRFTEDGPFDLLLTDLMMPEMRGDELAMSLRRREPQLRILYLTGFSDSLFKEKLSLWEHEAFLDKPASVKGILEAVSMSLFGRLLPDAQKPPSILGRFRARLAVRRRAKLLTA